jgi:hypothetical protein
MKGSAGEDGSAGKCPAGYFRKSRKNVKEKVKLLNRVLEKAVLLL